ncbi:hypothetical protein F8M41_006189 [Gigaspora margarita]|uniref:Uncharacterized protein n=1 Tax=Gigaspora margarita TaxID=4874 RepID=A0A8H3X9W9_GIGMA|nr:hypothetical protein F8M41_006189 [Gigaspora margarita]
MNDDINAERLPLLETEEDQNPINYKEQCCCCLFSIIMVIILFILIITSNSFSYSNLSTDKSIIPNEYRLRYKTFWEYNYIIEGYPTEFNGQTNNHQSDFIKYAEIVVPYWTYGNFNVVEFRYNKNGSIIPVLTATSKIDAYLTSEVEILFTADNSSDFGLESCEYRISWTWLFNGYIQRRCENNNESVFKQVAFFKGHPTWGLTFLSVDENINYGYSTRSAFFWDLYVRDVFIDPTAPFPPIIPSLYTAYYDYLQRIRQRHSNKRVDSK